MGNKMLIDATHAEETRVVVVRGNRIEEFDFESASRKQLKGNIYLAKVTRVEPSLQAAFVEYGGNRHGFLAFSEIHPDYYQIPLADRQALLREQEEEDAQDDDDNGHDNGHETSAPTEEPAVEESAASAGESEEDAGHPEEDSEEDAPPAQALRSEPLPSVSEEVSSGDEVVEARDAAESEIAKTAPHPEHGLPGHMGNGVEVVEEDAEARKVESIGAEDALEEVPRRRPKRAPRRTYKIQEVIKRRQIILVQVVKEERGNKGAALTTFLSLAGRYCVLMPNTARGGGISRKITDAGDRRRLKEVARDVEVPQGMGLIVRTAGAQRTRAEIKRDFDYLIRLWENVRDLTLNSTAPALVYEEGSLIKRSIRDLYTKDVDEVFVEGEDAYREAKDFMKMLMPSHAKNVKLYKDTRPLFSRHQVDTQLDALYSPTVPLPSGGYMVMNQTEALVSVDINSGKSTREHNIEDTALRTNQEASEEIARQLRLRDLAGLIVIDYIDMEEKRNNRAVERRLKEALKNDRARIQVGHISHFGLLEMSRQRLRPGLLEGSSRPCPHCEGRGIVRSVSSCGLSVLRAIEEHLINRRAENLTVKCNPEVAFYVLNEKRDHLLAIEQAYGISVFIAASEEVRGQQAVIERAGERTVTARRVQAAPVKIDSAFSANEPEAEPVVEEEAAAEEDSGEDQESREDSGSSIEGNGDGRPRRRRRGRRGGRKGERDGDESRPRQFQQSSGAADEPERPEDETDGDPGNAPQPDVEAESGEASQNGGDGNRERRGRRRDRWGRRGGRDRNGGERREARPDGDQPSETNGEAPAPRHEAPPPPPPAPVFAEPVAQEAAEPRRWQPPQATVQTQPAERKAGWWSKRG
ncbi:MAG: ribonuclease E/G [Aestuariivirga sp.]